MSRRLISGFTLLEVMVVMVIIAILATLFVFSVGAVRSNDPAFVESERLTSLLNLARDQALLDGLDLGLRVDPEGYRFVTTLDPRLVDWIEPADNQIFRPRSLAEGLEFRLWVEEQLVELEDPDRRRKKRETSATSLPPPQVLVLSSGDITPFRLVIRRDGREISAVTADTDGEISMESADDADF